MDSTIISLIGSVGFPIIMCLLMYKNQADTQELHKKEIDNLSTAVNNNTIILQKLCDKMEDNHVNTGL